MAENKNLYTDDSIESLSPLEHVRLRPGVYCGDTSNPNQLLLEIFANALDEVNIGHGNTIYVDANADDTVTVRDEGQGFPIGVTREDGCTILEAAFSVMNTSGKFRDDGVYEGTALGLNGMGAKIATFLSDWLEVKSSNGGDKFEFVSFKDGVRVDGSVKKVPENSRWTGTIVSFKPGAQFFDTTSIDKKFFENFFHDICCLNSNLKIKFNGVYIEHPNGMNDMIARKTENKLQVISEPFVHEYEKNEKQQYSFGLTITGGSSFEIFPYVNYGVTSVGPHITQIKSTITRVFNNWAREKKLLTEKDKNLEGAMLQEGMMVFCNIITDGVAYNAQVKTTVTKIDSSFVTENLAKQLEIWLDTHAADGKTIIEKALLARRAAEAAKKAKAAVKSKSEKKEEKVFKLPTTLTDCWTTDRSKAELMVCEGKSAAGGLVAARDSETQAVYGVRGKMLSVLKTTPEKILANQEINNLIQALGLECDKKTAKLKYDEKKLRYGKIIACADADFDGYAIENLLFNILWYMCPDLLIYGHVYSAIPPLYRVTTKKNEYVYLKDDEALEQYKIEHGKSIQSIGRLKGLGEQDAEELSYCLLDHNTRNIVQLEVNNVVETEKTFQDLYGKNVEPRVRFLNEHAEEARAEYE